MFLTQETLKGNQQSVVLSQTRCPVVSEQLHRKTADEGEDAEGPPTTRTLCLPLMPGRQSNIINITGLRNLT